MPALLPRDRSCWTWPAAWSAAAVLLLAALLVPEAWWWLLVPDRDLGRGRAREPAKGLELLDLEILRTPPEIVVSPDPRREDRPAPEPPLDPAWWTRAWNTRIVADLTTSPRALPDSLVPRPLLDILGARGTIELVLARPDSSVRAQLWLLVQEEKLACQDLDGLFSAIAKARAYADLKSREAAMYDEFLLETVPVPR